MSALVLSKKEQKKSLSGIKNRKKLQKNVLAAPDTFNISEPVLSVLELKNICHSLEGLLPCARLEKGRELGKNSSESDCCLKRKQLLLGINSISRAVGNGSVASVIFADDIKPKLLIKHLLVLCSLKDIPYIFLNNFRTLTRTALGFPCMAIGFKKDGTFFFPVSSLIKYAIKNHNDNSILPAAADTPAIQTRGTKTLEENIEDKTENCKNVQNTFTYLYRSTNQNRMFSTHLATIDQDQSSSKSFISLGNEDDVKNVFMKFGKKIHTGKAVKIDDGAVIGKKTKGRTYKEEPDSASEYSAAHIIKVRANPDREKKKYKKLKKG